jgi:hypothetical protein
VTERFRIWCGAAWSEHGWQWHWDVIDTELRPFDRRVSAPGVVARGWQPSWQRAMEAAAAHRDHIITWQVDLTYAHVFTEGTVR